MSSIVGVGHQEAYALDFLPSAQRAETPPAPFAPENEAAGKFVSAAPSTKPKDASSNGSAAPRESVSLADKAFKRWQERFLPADRSSPDGLQKLEEERQLKRLGLEPCTTCANRTYQDGSNDPGVSFKAPGHIAPEASASVVSAHEQEHVSNERAKAGAENRDVVSQSVQLFTSVCPECGRVYVSGGVTRTTTVSRPEKPKELDMIA